MKRITSVSALLAVLMAVSAFASCRKPNNSSETTDGKVSTGSNDGDQYQAEYLPDKNYDGYAIRSLTIQDSKYITLDIDSASANKGSMHNRSSLSIYICVAPSLFRSTKS